MSETLATSDDKRYRLRLVQDANPSNPRTEFDTHLANVITPKGQDFIDVDADGGPLQAAWNYYSAGHDDDDAGMLLARYARLHYGVLVIENHPHDGAWALWYVMPDKAAESTGSPLSIIESEQAEYQAWAEGEVYGYLIEERVNWGRRDGKEGELETWEHVDSCWGFIGYDYAKESAKEAFADYAGSE